MAMKRKVPLPVMLKVVSVLMSHGPGPSKLKNRLLANGPITRGRKTSMHQCGTYSGLVFVGGSH